MATTTVNGMTLVYEIKTDAGTGKQCVVITGTKGKAEGSLEIPAEIKKISVTSIGPAAFYRCNGLTSVTIPDGVTSIADQAFSFSGLANITIPNSVTSIGAGAFNCCGGLTSVTIPCSVTSIGNHAFGGCSGLTSVTIPDSVTSIGEEAFCDCSGLKCITIPNSVTSIEYGVFSGCSGLTSITIPDSVTSIGESAFCGCSGLASVMVPDSVTSIEDKAFKGCKGLADKNGFVILRNVLYDYFGNGETVVIPKGVTSIGGEAFFDRRVKSVTISEGVTSIGDSAFSCEGLTSISIPDSVTSIGEGVFQDCSDLENLLLPKHMEGRLSKDALEGVPAWLKITYRDKLGTESTQKETEPASKVTFEELALRVVDYINSNGKYSACFKDDEFSIKIGSCRLQWPDAYSFLAAEKVDGNGPTLNVFSFVRRWDHKWDYLGRAERNFVKKCEKLLHVSGKTPEQLAASLDAAGIGPAQDVAARIAVSHTGSGKEKPAPAKKPVATKIVTKKPAKKPAAKKAIKKTTTKK